MAIVDESWSLSKKEESGSHGVECSKSGTMIALVKDAKHAEWIVSVPEFFDTLDGVTKALKRMIDKYDPDTIEAEWIGHANELLIKAKRK